jgi:hypothetical protein
VTVRDAYRVRSAVRKCVRRDPGWTGIGTVLPGGDRHPMGGVSTLHKHGVSVECTSGLNNVWPAVRVRPAQGNPVARE